MMVKPLLGAVSHVVTQGKGVESPRLTTDISTASNLNELPQDNNVFIKKNLHF